MLEASRSTGSPNVPETMRLPGIKRSTLFRRRDTCSTARKFDSRIAVRNIERRRVPVSDVEDTRYSRVPKQVDSENNVGNLTDFRGPGSHKNCNSRKSKDEKSTELIKYEKSAPQVRSNGKQEFENFENWEWKFDETPRRSSAMLKLRYLQRQRADLLTGLRSSLQHMLKVVREMKNH